MTRLSLSLPRADLLCMISLGGTSSEPRLLIVDQFNESDISTQRAAPGYVSPMGHGAKWRIGG